MKYLRNKGLLVAVGLAALALAAGCDGTVVTMYDYHGSYDLNGQAVDVVQSSGYGSLAGATVTLTNYYNSGSSYSTTVASNGSFSLSTLPGGKYVLTGSGNSYAYIPMIVDVGIGTATPYLLAFPAGSANAITAVMTWDNSSQNMHLSMTWGAEAPIGSDNANLLSSGTKTGTNWSANKRRSGSSGNRVETIIVSASGGGPNETFRFYINSDTEGGASGNLPGVAPSGASVHFFNGTKYLGSFFAPYDTNDTILRIASLSVAGADYILHTDTQSDHYYRGLAVLPLVGKPVSNFQ